MTSRCSTIDSFSCSKWTRGDGCLACQHAHTNARVRWSIIRSSLALVASRCLGSITRQLITWWSESHSPRTHSSSPVTNRIPHKVSTSNDAESVSFPTRSAHLKDAARDWTVTQTRAERVQTESVVVDDGAEVGCTVQHRADGLPLPDRHTTRIKRNQPRQTKTPPLGHLHTTCWQLAYMRLGSDLGRPVLLDPRLLQDRRRLEAQTKVALVVRPELWVAEDRPINQSPIQRENETNTSQTRRYTDT